MHAYNSAFDFLVLQTTERLMSGRCVVRKLSSKSQEPPGQPPAHAGPVVALAVHGDVIATAGEDQVRLGMQDGSVMDGRCMAQAQEWVC